MPRVYNCGKSVDEWCKQTGNGSATADICADCAEGFSCDFPTLEPDLDKTGHEGPIGEDGWEIGAEHPCYSECDYNCALCNEKLTEDDN